MSAFFTTGSFRWLDKSQNCNDRDLYSNWFSEMICMNGQIANYYVHGYALSGHDFLYGEDPTSTFHQPVSVIIMPVLNENSLILSKYGIVSDDDLTFIIHITAFYEAFGAGKEPKADDVFELTEYGQDRPGGRGAKKFQITKRVDQDVNQINPLMGHYVWLVTAKRYEYSFEPGISAEPVSDQVYDDTFAGRLSGYTNPKTPDKLYTDNADLSSKGIFNYDIYGELDKEYGGYN